MRREEEKTLRSRENGKRDSFTHYPLDIYCFIILFLGYAGNWQGTPHLLIELIIHT